MKHQYYLPNDDLGRVNWLNNFALKLADYAAILGLTPLQMAAVGADAAAFAFVVALLTPFREFVKQLTGYKDALIGGSAAPIGDIPNVPVVEPHTTVLSGIFVRIADLVQTIKSNPAYDEETMGKNLGIVGSEIEIDYATLKPEPKLTIKNEHAYSTWKHNHTEATDVYADYDDGIGFHLVGRMVKSHYLDPHLPAVNQSKIYKFKFHYVLNGEPIGQESEIVTITVTGPKE
jgi:hypothetical protein